MGNSNSGFQPRGRSKRSATPPTAFGQSTGVAGQGATAPPIASPFGGGSTVPPIAQNAATGVGVGGATTGAATPALDATAGRGITASPFSRPGLPPTAEPPVSSPPVGGGVTPEPSTPLPVGGSVASPFGGQAPPRQPGAGQALQSELVRKGNPMLDSAANPDAAAAQLAQLGITYTADPNTGAITFNHPGAGSYTSTGSSHEGAGAGGQSEWLYKALGINPQGAASGAGVHFDPQSYAKVKLIDQAMAGVRQGANNKAIRGITNEQKAAMSASHKDIYGNPV